MSGHAPACFIHSQRGCSKHRSLCVLPSSAMSSAAATRLPSGIPSLKQFVLRSEVRALYRNVLRSTKTLDFHRREEIRQHARWEIVVVRDVTDQQHIRMMLTQGRRQLEQLQMMISRGG